MRFARNPTAPTIEERTYVEALIPSRRSRERDHAQDVSGRSFWRQTGSHGTPTATSPLSCLTNGLSSFPQTATPSCALRQVRLCMGQERNTPGRTEPVGGSSRAQSLCRALNYVEIERKTVFYYIIPAAFIGGILVYVFAVRGGGLSG